MVVALRSCPYPGCEAEGDLAKAESCPTCHQPIWVCPAPACRSTNQVLAAFCRSCGAAMPHLSGSWTHIGRDSSRDAHLPEFPAIPAKIELQEHGAAYDCRGEVRAGVLCAYGAVYVTTIDGRVIQLGASDLSYHRSWASLGGGERHESTPVIQGHRMFVTGTSTLTMFHLRGGGEPEEIHRLDDGWQFGRSTLVACARYVAAAAYQGRGEVWKVLVFPLWGAETPELGWASEEMANCDGVLRPVITPRNDILIILTGSGSVREFAPLDAQKPVAVNLRAGATGFLANVMPVIRGDYVYVFTGQANEVSLVRVNLKYNRLPVDHVRDTGGRLPRGLLRWAGGFVVVFDSGFEVLADGGQTVDQSDRPQGVHSDAAIALGTVVGVRSAGTEPGSATGRTEGGSLLLLSSREKGQLHPYVVTSRKAELMARYPLGSPLDVPYVGLVPAGGGVVAVRGNGIVEGLEIVGQVG